MCCCCFVVVVVDVAAAAAVKVGHGWLWAVSFCFVFVTPLHCLCRLSQALEKAISFPNGFVRFLFPFGKH